MTECVFCAMACTITDSLKCEFGSERYHLACCGVQSDKSEEIISLAAIMGWSCRACRIDISSQFASLKQTVSNLSAEITLLQSTRKIPTSTLPSATTGLNTHDTVSFFSSQPMILPSRLSPDLGRRWLRRRLFNRPPCLHTLTP